jgi:hypothetical protein
MDTSEQILDINIGEVNDKTEIEVIDSGKFAILFILTLGLYGAWWTYKAWRFFKQKEDLDIMPAARAIFSIFFTYSLFSEIKDYAKENGYTNNYHSGLLFIGILVLTLLSRLPEPYFLIYALGFVFFIQPNNAFNFAIENSEEYKATRSGFSLRQIILVVVGGAFWALIILGLIALKANL